MVIFQLFDQFYESISSTFVGSDSAYRKYRSWLRGKCSILGPGNRNRLESRTLHYLLSLVCSVIRNLESPIFYLMVLELLYCLCFDWPVMVKMLDWQNQKCALSAWAKGSCCSSLSTSDGSCSFVLNSKSWKSSPSYASCLDLESFHHLSFKYGYCHSFNYIIRWHQPQTSSCSSTQQNISFYHPVLRLITSMSHSTALF